MNLIWAELMGVGIVDPPFGFDLDSLNTQAAHPELLDAMAKDFEAHHYDLRYLINDDQTKRTYRAIQSQADWRPTTKSCMESQLD